MYFPEKTILNLKDQDLEALVKRESENLDFLQDADTQRITVLSEGVEHWVPQVTQYIMKHRIGTISYPTETDESR